MRFLEYLIEKTYLRQFKSGRRSRRSSSKVASGNGNVVAPPVDPTLADNALFFQVAKPVIEAGRTLLKYERLYVLWQAVQNVYHMQGAGAEVGSFRGGSACFLASAFKTLAGEEFPFHIFDTFEGHPSKTDPQFDPVHKPGMFSGTSYEEVKAYLSPFVELVIHKGEFSESVREIGDMSFCLVHIDVDIYRSTLDCLKYFGPRLLSGGVIVIDDYGAAKCPGVKRAIMEFLEREESFQVWYMRTEQLVLVKKWVGSSSPCQGPRGY